MKLKYIIILTIVLFLSKNTFGQNWVLQTGIVSILSEAPLNTVKGSTPKFDCIVNTKSKIVTFSCDANTLDFGNPLIKENFSTHILNTKKYPLITFSGKVVKIDERNKTLTLKGAIEMNGQKKNVDVLASWTKSQKNVKLILNYELFLKEFNIDIPCVLLDTISEKVSVSINASLIEK